MGLNDEIQDLLVDQAVELVSVENELRGRIVALLVLLAADLRLQILKAELSDHQSARFKELLKSANKSISETYTKVSSIHTRVLSEIAEFSVEDTRKLILGLQVFSSFNTSLSLADLKVLATDTLIEGAPSAEWWSIQKRSIQDRFKRQVRIGMAQGETMSQIVGRVRGTTAGKFLNVTQGGVRKRVREYKGGILDVSKREAETLVRTSVQTVSNAVLASVYEENRDLLRGLKAMATLDTRTTPICIARDGAVWDMDGKALAESPNQEDFPGPPPWHFNCRTVLLPIVKHFRDLEGKILELPPGTRASIDGQVPDTLTFSGWLKTQSEARQNKALGKARADLWRSGKIKLSQLIDNTGRTLTVSELSKLR